MFTGSAICVSYKLGLLNKEHNMATDVFKIALYNNTSSLDASTSVYTTTGEVAGTNYVAGGVTMVNQVPVTSGLTAYAGFQDVTFANVTLTSRGALIYNSSNANKAVAVIDFGLDITKTAQNLVVTMPQYSSQYALIQLG